MNYYDVDIQSYYRISVCLYSCKTLTTGFEPARGIRNGFQVHPLNHSGTSAQIQSQHITKYIVYVHRTISTIA